ncbi:Scr1 family TA system antitoxin-like transcriptional regulator [Streptomyces sp. NBC_00354]|uniref:Scr1 family TA system antitoxin-like transcriptional regulator n=2 Tax=unclassified Streptomyces TaxID=2593676 RepID=UPI002E258028
MSSPLSSAQEARTALAVRLRHLRLDAGLTGAVLSARCGWHPAKTSRIERGQAPPSDTDIRLWTDACGAADQEADLIAASRTASSMYMEWKRLNRAGLTRLQQEIAPLLDRTRTFRVYCSNVVPGLLQTHDYATTVITAYSTFHHTPDTDVESAARARTARAKLLTRRGRTFAFLLEDTTLRPGIADPQTTAAQLDHLLDVMALPQVSLGIIPAGTPRPLWAMESFTVYDTAQVGIELLAARVTITAPGELALYEKAFAQLAAIAAYGPAARARIEQARTACQRPTRNFPQEH